jgi:hypothetical protein
MRSVSDEPALRAEGAFQPLQQSVDRVGEVLQLVLRSAEGEPLVEVVLRDSSRCRRDDPQRPQGAAGKQPAKQRRYDGHDAKSDQRRQEQLMRQ